MLQKLMSAVLHGAAACLLAIYLPCVVQAGSISAPAGSGEPEEEEELANVAIGPFDGLDLKARRIWINDRVYILDNAVRVKGTASKLGLITDLKQGEKLKATLRPNDDTSGIPYVILIERQ